MGPSWKDILTIAVMARRPSANTAFEFVVIRQMLLCDVKVKPAFPTRPQKTTSWTFEKTTKPLSTSESLMPMGGDR